MRNDAFNTWETDDISIYEGIDSVQGDDVISFLVITNFDVNKKFGINLEEQDDRWDDLYADYNPFTNELKMFYYIQENYAIQPVQREYYPLEDEKKIIIEKMEQACIEDEGMTCKAYMLKQLTEKYDNPVIKCEKTDDGYALICYPEQTIIQKDDINSELKDLFGKSFDITVSGNTNVKLVCVNDGRVIYSSEDEMQKFKNEIKVSIPKERMEMLFGKALCQLGEFEHGAELYDTFRNDLCMSNDEITYMGFGSLKEFYENEDMNEETEDEGMTLT